MKPYLLLMLLLLPALAGAAAPAVVDEPVGARHSLGMTLWHLGHDAGRIRQFHHFIQEQRLRPQDLLPAGRLRPPAALPEALLEPELLPEEQRAGWVPQGEYLTSGAGDAGPTVSLPLRVERAGLYRLWVRYYGWPTGTAVTGLKIHRAGREGEGPLLNDEVHDTAAAKEGPAWKDVLVDLDAGDHVVRLGHVTRWWHAGSGPKGYLPRKIDCLYLTAAVWEDSPSDERRRALREGGTPAGIQWSASRPLARADAETWRWWQVRPVSWEDAAALPRLFDLSRRFWRREVDALAAQETGADLPDYRAPVRQVVFDDAWNLVGNPARIRRQAQALSGDVTRQPGAHHWCWVAGAEFRSDGGWEQSGTSLRGGYWDFPNVAKAGARLEHAGQYHVWVRFGNLKGYFAPWRATVSLAGGASVQFDHDQKEYPDEWHKMGVLDAAAPGDARLEVRPLGFRTPGTYRVIHDFFLTTDANYTPKGSVRPPLSRADYLSRARALGATEKAPYLMWAFPDAYAAPLSNEVWAKESWPAAPVAPGGRTHALTLAADTCRAVQVGLRSVADSPLTLKVTCGPLIPAGTARNTQHATRGKAGSGSVPADAFPGRVTWRVIGFVPYGESRQAWSPFCLLRRPWVTLPPLGAAGVWLTVSSQGVPAGEYSAPVTFSGKGLAPQRLTLRVRVFPVRPAPEQPVLVSGWTAPPQGEAYLRDYADHGMNTWYAELTKEEMRRHGIRLLLLPQWDANEEQIRARVERLRAGGLDYADWAFTIRDEPTGKDEAGLKDYLDVARAIRKVDPKARVSFNPGDTASAATFRTLAPWCDFWIPYAHHRVYPPQEAAAKREVFTPKPWMWYTTPCLWDKSPALPAQLYEQIRSVPTQPGNCVGTAFFAFYYPFRDAWDTAYEHLPDAAVTVLPSRQGPVPTRAWEAIREGVQHANLARMVKERAAGGPEDVAKLVEQGSVEQLLAWLETHAAP